mgnify:CR=1 FL=1
MIKAALEQADLSPSHPYQPYELRKGYLKMKLGLEAKGLLQPDPPLA